MKVRKNLEAVFLAAAVMASFAAYATAEVPVVHVAKPVAVKVSTVSTDPNMVVITATAKRLTAAEKAAMV
jgi:hypothetical protein